MKTVTYDETKWKLVPIEPTPKMVDATFNDDLSALSHNKRNKHIYCAMIKAAPPYPDQSGEAAEMVWIPVSERLPENDLLVLIFTDNNDIITGSYNSVDYEGCWRIGNSSIIWDHNFNLNLIVNKWMPMPAAPKEPE